MTDYSKLSKTPGQVVDLGSVRDFTDGIFGINRERNRRAYQKAGKLTAAYAAVLLYGKLKGKV